MRPFSSSSLAAIVLAASLLSTSVVADDWRWHGDIHQFHEHDFEHWRDGQWVEGFHEGRQGWWWIVDGTWYYYPAPIYPYPDPYTPPSVMAQQAPPAAVVAPSYLYYCPNPSGYYPYVPQCFGPWQRIAPAAAAPSAIVQQPIPAPAPQPMPEPGTNPRIDDINQLRMLETEFKDVDLRDKYARAALQGLDAQVEDFRQSLYQRAYNAMDLLKQAEILQHRIDGQIALLKHKPGTPPAASNAPHTP